MLRTSSMYFLISFTLCFNLYGQSKNEILETSNMVFEAYVFLDNRFSPEILGKYIERTLLQYKLSGLCDRHLDCSDPLGRRPFEQDSMSYAILRVNRVPEDIEIYIDYQKLEKDSLQQYKIRPGHHELIFWHPAFGIMVKKDITIKPGTENEIRALFTPNLSRDAIINSVLLPGFMQSYIRSGPLPKVRSYIYKFGTVLSAVYQILRRYKYLRVLNDFEQSDKAYMERVNLIEAELDSLREQKTLDYSRLTESVDKNRIAFTITSTFYVLNLVDLLVFGSGKLDVEILPAAQLLRKVNPAFSYAGNTIQFGVNITF